MELINTNRLRLSARTFRRGYAESFRWWRWTTYHSSDHDKPRLENNCVLETCGLVLSAKWRPDGRNAETA
jgi:hypothetical protein